MPKREGQARVRARHLPKSHKAQVNPPQSYAETSIKGNHLVADFLASAGPGIARAREIDAAWFQAHPTRSHRLRRAIIGEMPGIDVEAVLGDTWVAVRQIKPGVRVKMPFTPPTQDVPPESEALAHAIFDMCAKHAGRYAPQGELTRHVHALSHGGRA